MNVDLTLIAAQAVANAQSLRDDRRDAAKALNETSRLVLALNDHAKVAKHATVGQREIHFATGFLLQATERWARYLQYETEADRAADWREAAFAFVALVTNAVQREAA